MALKRPPLNPPRVVAYKCRLYKDCSIDGCGQPARHWYQLAPNRYVRTCTSCKRDVLSHLPKFES